MPIYEFECECSHKEEKFFTRSHDADNPQSCPVCGKTMKRLFPLIHFNVMNQDYRPGIETKWNYNPEAAFGDNRGCGAEYSHRRRELMTGRHRFDIGKHKSEWAHHLKGTRMDQYRRTGKLPPVPDTKSMVTNAD